MMYPQDPNGSFGPEYPKNFEKWYLAVIAVLFVIVILFFSGCTPYAKGQVDGDKILNHCADTAYVDGDYSEKLFEKCVTDSLYVLDQLG